MTTHPWKRNVAFGGIVAALAFGVALVAGRGAAAPPHSDKHTEVPPSVATSEQKSAALHVADPAGPAHQADAPSAVVQGKGQTAQVDIASARRAAAELRAGRDNAFFDEKTFLSTFAQHGAAGIDALRGALASTDELAELPPDVAFLSDAPPVVTERMGVIDMLGRLSRGEHPDLNARDALAEIAVRPINGDLPPQAIKVLVGESFDAFLELARTDWPTATQTYAKLENQALKKTFRGALIGGLVETGTPPQQATEIVERL